ncbi:MAG TPA: amidase family protein, partial [Solirubrobacteraceae bacterium]|nr:amidase family protein [Solirubrobacteraceae bacterium]
NVGVWPATGGSAEAMLATGPLTRRAEDLMPLLRILAGVEAPAGASTPGHGGALGDPAAVSLDGLLVTTVEGASRRPMSRSLRDARERAAGALASAGARLRTVNLPSWRDAMLPFLAMLQDNGGTDPRATRALLVEAGAPPLGWRQLMFGSGSHTLPTRLTLMAEALPSSPKARQRLIARGHQLAQELEEAMAGGVLLHPAHLTPAPRHRRTYGRPWLTTPASIFNIAGVPVTEVPLGLSPQGLPVGVQVAAPHGADHLSIAIALELEAVFGGWVMPPGID